jgi:hypothetical protein
MGLLNRENIETIQPPENPIEALRQEHAKLSRQLDLLHGKALCTPYKPDKDKIMQQRAELTVQASKIQDEIIKLENTQAGSTLNDLIITKANDFVTRINGKRVKVEENLDVTLTYEGCQHTKNLKIPELLSYYTEPTPSNTALLDTWKRILTLGDNVIRTIPCRECQAVRLKKLHEEHTYAQTFKIGIAKIEISAIR